MHIFMVSISGVIGEFRDMMLFKIEGLRGILYKKNIKLKKLLLVVLWEVDNC